MTTQSLEHNADILVCQWQYEDLNGCQIIDANKIDANIYGNKTAEEFAEFFYREQYERMVVCVVWNKLYKSCVFDNIRFFGKRSEDEKILTTILGKNHSVFVIKDFLYVYCQNQDSLTNSPFSADSLIFLDALVERVEYFHDNKFIAENSRLLYCEMYISFFYASQKAGIEMRDIKQFDKIVKGLFFSDLVTIKFLIRMFLFRISPQIYAKILKVK